MKNVRAGIIPVLALITVFIAGCSSTPEPTATPEDQLAALRGEDIILEPLSGEYAFIEPLPEDALILKDIHFDFDKSEIKEPAKLILAEIKTWMLNHPDTKLMIEGHCDERGTKEYNIALGERRALSVRSHLVGLGINPARMQTISYGEEKPLCTTSEESCWWKNRRAHFLADYGRKEAAGMEAEVIEPEKAKEEIEEEVVVEESVPEPREEEPAVEEEEGSTRQRMIGRYHY
jgi:peptidoglycan-associated lipoprotein